MRIGILLSFIAMVSAPLALAQEITGLWKHAQEPGWIEIEMQEGVAKGTLVRNDAYPERVGREILKELVLADKDKALWRGQVYAERLGEYKDADIILATSDSLQMKVKVGFMSRTINWVRVEELPGQSE